MASLSIFSIIVALLIAILCSVMFTVTSRAIVLNDGGEKMSTVAALFWVIAPVTIQAAALIWLCHPATYLVFMVLIIMAEAATISRSTSPGMRFLSWFWLAVSVQAGSMIVGAGCEGAWAFSGRRVILYLIPLAVFLALGLALTVLYGDEKKPSEEIEETDDEQGNFIEIDPEDVEDTGGEPSVA